MKKLLAKQVLFAALLLASATNMGACSDNKSDPSDNDTASTDGDTDGDSDADTDADSDTDSDTDSENPCQTGNTTLDWVANPPGLDCGPGCTQLTFVAHNGMTGWSASEDYVVFTEDGDPRRTFAVDLNTNCTAEMVYPLGNMQNPIMNNPSVKGSRVAVVASDGVGDSWLKAIAHFDLSSGDYNVFGYEEELVSEPPTSYTRYRHLDMSDDAVAVLQSTPASIGNFRPKLWDTTDWLPTTPVEDYFKRFYIGISGDYLIWSQGYDNYACWIYAHKLSTGTTWQIDENPAYQAVPRIDGSRVVWSDERNGGGNYENLDIYMHDFSTGETTRVTDGAWIQAWPDVSGDRVVWHDYRDCPSPNNPYDWTAINVWMKDLSTGEEHQITSEDSMQVNPQIAGNKVFFEGYAPADGILAIFVQDLADLGL